MSAKARQAREFVEAALRMHDEALWNVFEDDDAVAFEIAGEKRPLIGLVMGQLGEEFGLALFLGGLQQVDDLFTAHNDVERAECMDEIVVSVAPLRDTPEILHGLLDAAGWSWDRDALVPSVMVKRRGKPPRSPHPSEVRLALFAINALLYAHDRGKLEPLPYDHPEGIQLLRASGKPNAPAVTFGKYFEEDFVPTPRGPVAPPLTARNHHVLRSRWMVGFFPLAPIADSGAVAHVLLVAELGGSERIVKVEPFAGEAIGEAAAALVACADGNNDYGAPVLPRELRFLDEDLLEVAAPPFEAAGVRCVHAPRQPELVDILDDLVEHMQWQGLETDEPSMPDPEWKEWSEALDELVELGGITMRARNLATDRIYGRYVGDTELGLALFARAAPSHLAGPLSAWMVARYRPRPNSKTVLEHVLQRKMLSPSVRELAEGLRDAAPALYEIVEVDEDLARLRDLATGQVLDDVILPTPARAGSVWPGLVHPAGPFRLLAPIGPAVPPRFAGEVEAVLARHGIAIEPESLATHDYFGGRIAAWLEETRAYDTDDPHAADEEEAGRAADDPLVDVHRQMQRRWLDAAIPAFDGRTPREMCRTPEGRKQVADLIRSMRKPSPTIPDAAHQEMIEDMLDELGLA